MVPNPRDFDNPVMEVRSQVFNRSVRPERDAACVGATVLVDETKRAGYVVAAVAVTNPEAARRMLRGLVLPGQRRIHMKQEHPRRRRAIVSAVICTAGLELTIYDAARRYPTEREARAMCIASLVRDLAASNRLIELIIEQDDSLLSFDNQRLIEAVRDADAQETVRYRHARAHTEPLLALPDVAAWCWARSGDWRRRIAPILASVRSV